MKNILIELIASFLSGKSVALPKEADWGYIYAVSKHHDIAQIAAEAILKQGLLPDCELLEAFKKQRLLAVYRREQLDYEQERICKALESEKAEYILLKGAVLKNYYPQGWMRSSCDIDILIKPCDKSRAIDAILALGYTQDTDGERDASLISKSGVNSELHFSITCGNEKLDSLLRDAFSRSDYLPNRFERVFDNEFFVYYHIAHMQNHFTEGGCGIRPFIDLWLYSQKCNYDEGIVREMLENSGSLAFYDGVKALIEVWFGSAEHSELTKMLEEYIISGGVYGTRENLGATGRHKEGGFFKYLLRRIFMPRERLRLIYPKIDKYPVLIPYYQVKRWFTLFDKSKFESAKSEIAGNKKAASTAELFSRLGL